MKKKDKTKAERARMLELVSAAVATHLSTVVEPAGAFLPVSQALQAVTV